MQNTIQLIFPNEKWWLALKVEFPFPLYVKDIIIRFRWLNSFKISSASIHKQRDVAKRWCGENFLVEEAPFKFPLKDKKGQFEVKSAPFSYIVDLKEHVLERLDSMKR